MMYSNVGQNVPLLKEKGDVFFQGAFSSSGGEENAEGGGFQFAYAVSDHWLVHSSLYVMGNTNSSDLDDWRGSGRYFEVGGGYFSTSQNKKWVYELTGGLGFSGIKNHLGGASRDYINVNHFKPYIQPVVGFSLKHFELAFSPRISYVNFSNKEYELFDVSLASEVENFFNQQNDALVLDPGITIRGGIENIKLQLQLVFSTFDQDRRFINDNFFSIGLAFSIPSSKD